MRIKSVELNNIGVFDNQKIEFKPNAKENKGKAEIHIFTGPNGSGKTTLLYSLAHPFEFDRTKLIKEGSLSHLPTFERNGNNLFYKRFRYFGNDKNALKSNMKVLLYHQNQTYTHTIDGNKNVDSTSTYNAPLIQYQLETFEETSLLKPFSFAAFAYSGYRTTKNESIDAIKDIKGNPLKTALSFEKDINDLNINQWIANNISISALEQINHNPSKAEKHKNTVKFLSKILSDIIGYPIGFELQTSPIRLVVAMRGEQLDFDVLPDGLRSMISWIADLLMRLDLIPWEDDIPIFERNIILFLDEIEVHLHPSWQRKVLPIIQKLFPNAQIFLTTHSPFIVNSIDGAWVHELNINASGKIYIEDEFLSKTSDSIDYTLKKAFNIEESFGWDTQEKLNQFYKIRDEILNNDNSNKSELLKISKDLLKMDDIEIANIVDFELRQLAKLTADKSYIK